MNEFGDSQDNLLCSISPLRVIRLGLQHHIISRLGSTRQADPRFRKGGKESIESGLMELGIVGEEGILSREGIVVFDRIVFAEILQIESVERRGRGRLAE